MRLRCEGSYRPVETTVVFWEFRYLGRLVSCMQASPRPPLWRHAPLNVSCARPEGWSAALEPNGLPWWICGWPAIGSAAPGNWRTDPSHPALASKPAYEPVMGLKLLRTALIALALLGSPLLVVAADSDLLNSVKRNPEKAKAMCRSFRQMNANGRSPFSKPYINQVAASEKLSFQDAEILMTYIVGMHCADVR